mmetsp:Transcript_13235/g.37590  ORF Transcript_13235/g.37590 Transcript_13235/m.37590 type:complete len:465 (-) Transcript_13235:432-1826(-)
MVTQVDRISGIGRVVGEHTTRAVVKEAHLLLLRDEHPGLLVPSEFEPPPAVAGRDAGHLDRDAHIVRQVRELQLDADVLGKRGVQGKPLDCTCQSTVSCAQPGREGGSVEPHAIVDDAGIPALRQDSLHLPPEPGRERKPHAAAGHRQHRVCLVHARRADSVVTVVELAALRLRLSSAVDHVGADLAKHPFRQSVIHSKVHQPQREPLSRVARITCQVRRILHRDVETVRHRPEREAVVVLRTHRLRRGGQRIHIARGAAPPVLYDVRHQVHRRGGQVRRVAPRVRHQAVHNRRKGGALGVHRGPRPIRGLVQFQEENPRRHWVFRSQRHHLRLRRVEVVVRGQGQHRDFNYHRLRARPDGVARGHRNQKLSLARRPHVCGPHRARRAHGRISRLRVVVELVRDGIARGVRPARARQRYQLQRGHHRDVKVAGHAHRRGGRHDLAQGHGGLLESWQGAAVPGHR